MRDDEVTGVDPSVFRRYFREEGLEDLKDSEAEENNDVNLVGGYNRAEVRDYKMPRRKTTKRRKARKVPETDSPCLVDIPASSSLSVRTSKEISSSPNKEAAEKISHESREQLEVKIEQIGRQLNSLEHRLTADIQTILALLEQAMAPAGSRAPLTGPASKVQHSLKTSSQPSDPSQARELSDQTEPASSQRRPDRPPKLARRLFPSSDSSSLCEDDGWKSANREDSRCSEPVTTPGTTESLEFKSTQEAPIARLESLEELETSQEGEGGSTLSQGPRYPVKKRSDV